MVNYSSYTEQIPEQINDQTKYISDGPLYDPRDVLSILSKGDANTIPWTRGCRNDLQKWSLDVSDARQLIEQAISGGQYLNSQWCVQKPTGPWAACDSYRLVREEWVQHAHKEMQIEYYVKFAIGRTGKILLIISCHPSS